MGRDKALLAWHGRPLLAQACRLLAEAGAQPVCVSGDYPGYGGVADRTPGLGPLGGLHTVLDKVPDGPAWILPVDMPLLDVELLHLLRDAPPAPCAIFAGQPLPMRLRVDARCRAMLARMLADPEGPRSLHALQQMLGTVVLPLPQGAAARLANCNTPEDWRNVAT